MPDAKITALILVPDAGDKHGLLREGPCGARPPVVGWVACPSCEAGHWRADFAGRLHVPCSRCKDPGGGSNWLHDTGRRALVLAWDGKSTEDWWLPRVVALPPMREHATRHDVSMAWWITGWIRRILRENHRIRLPVDPWEALGTIGLLDGNGRAVTP